jgi:hypothetical protein
MQVLNYSFKCGMWHTPVFKTIITEAFIKSINMESIKTYRKVATVEAIQWTGHNATEVMLFVGKKLNASSVPHGIEREHDNIPNGAYQIEIPTEEGVMIANKLDYICKGIEGECWPVRKDIFLKTYEVVN